MRCFVIAMTLLFSISSNAQEPKKIFTCMVPIAASYPGGTNSLHHFIYQNFVQPDTVPDSTFCKKGRVKFTINKNGIACNFEIVAYLGYGCDEEIIRILKLTRWECAIFEGKKVEDAIILPYTIMFEKSEPANSNTSPQLAPVCPSQMPLAKYVL